MGLAGLPLGTLLGIFGGAAALVVVFYILKLRRRAVPGGSASVGAARGRRGFKGEFRGAVSGG